ncbi:MAG: BON domain-containing protein [Sphingomonas sp.]|jgi:osmotically-inducible protein OsmY|uniref:BON domain-containing protein n=1 Tax=Sphingomonas sp. TaxID=28214 RepID=UPI003561A8D1
MKSDSQLQHDVIAELEWDPSVHHTDIGVGVIDGIVTLSGHVRSFAEKVAAEKAVRRVAGVRALAEELKVRYPSDPKTADTEIANRIADMFAWDVSIPDEAISVKVEHGWVTLSGTVDWYFQKDAARRSAGKINGVTGVSDLVALRAMPAASDVRERIMAAFERSADLDAAAVTIVTDGGKVTLGGRVDTWNERRIAERAAWAAPGVSSVVANIVVG